MKLTKEQCVARYEAYLEACEHLYAEWTDDKTERAQGLIVAEVLRATAYLG